MKQADSPYVPSFPGIPATVDGTGGVVWVETRISQGACAYPITSSTTMGVQFAEAVAEGKTNLWGEPLIFIQAESEHSSASASEGFALAGGRVTNFTSGQGLVLMKEVLHVISGKRLPIVFHIGARALTSHALNVHAGHDDIMGVADTGWGILFARNAQETADLALIARHVAEATGIPFLNVQDGFLTTHTIETIVLPEEELMRRYIGAPSEKLRPVFDTVQGIMSGTVQNQDAFMRGKIAQRFFYDKVPGALEAAMGEYSALTGRGYGKVRGYRMDDAEFAIVALGSMAEAAEEVADYMREKRSVPVGVVHPTVYRPFPGPELVEILRGVRGLAVVERMDNPMAQSNPLTAELKAAFSDALSGKPEYPAVRSIPEIISGSAGLGSRDIRPQDLIAVVDAIIERRSRYFSLNIDHDSALPVDSPPDLRPEGVYSLRGYSIGGFGSVTTNKLMATVAADLFGLNVQAYPKYGSEKKGLPTNYYLTLAREPIRTHSEMERVEFIPLNDVYAMELGNPFEGLSDGGMVFVQWPHEDPQSIWEQVPLPARQTLRQANARVFYLDAARIAREIASRPDLEIRMQGIVLLGVFLRCAPFREDARLDDETLFNKVQEALRHYFGKVSDKVVEENLRCVERGYREVLEVPPALIHAVSSEDDAAVKAAALSK